MVKKLASRTIEVASFLAFLYAGFGYLNYNYLHWVDSFWLSTYSDRVAIVAFGIWVVARGKNRYTRNRIAVMVSLTAIGYLVIPYFTGSKFFYNHLIGSFFFFSYLLLVFSFGRRADCSWYCPCVGIRDTAGHTFRGKTLKGDFLWKLRYVKWIWLASLMVYLFLLLVFPNALLTNRYIFYFLTVTNGLYFLSFVVVPWTGNRNYCRYMCPYGTTFGAIGNNLGFFKIEADRERCIYCNLCEKECDLGIPIRSLIRTKGEIKVADCVGCGRCIQVCPKGALHFVDIRDYLGFRHEFPQPLKAKAKPSVEQREEVPAGAAGDAPLEISRDRGGKNTYVARMAALAAAVLTMSAYGLSQALPGTTGQSTSAPTPIITPGPELSATLSAGPDATGVLTEDVEVVSDDGLAVLKLPRGTKVLDAQGQPLAAITVTAMRLTLRDDAAWVGLAYEFGPEGATLDPLALLTISYDPRANYPFAYQDIDTKLVYLAYVGKNGPLRPALASEKSVQLGLTSGLGGAATPGTGGTSASVTAKIGHLGTLGLFCEVFSIPLS